MISGCIFFALAAAPKLSLKYRPVSVMNKIINFVNQKTVRSTLTVDLLPQSRFRDPEINL